MRTPGWEQRLEAYLTAIHRAPFDAVTHNCATFVLNAVAALEGRVPAEILDQLGFELPANELGVARILATYGGVEGLCAHYFGRGPRGDLARACRGDVALFDGTDGRTLGIVEVGGAICLTSRGLQRHRMLDCLGYWRT